MKRYKRIRRSTTAVNFHSKILNHKHTCKSKLTSKKTTSTTIIIIIIICDKSLVIKGIFHCSHSWFITEEDITEALRLEGSKIKTSIYTHSSQTYCRSTNLAKVVTDSKPLMTWVLTVHIINTTKISRCLFGVNNAKFTINFKRMTVQTRRLVDIFNGIRAIATTSVWKKKKIFYMGRDFFNVFRHLRLNSGQGEEEDCGR